MNNTLYVVTPIFNPCRYRSRISLYKEFNKYVNGFKNVKLYTVEIAYGDRDYCVTSNGKENELQLRSSFELWHKERATNLLIQRLPKDWKYVACIDADITFARPDWVEETVQLLQHYPVIQMFSQAVDLSPDFEFINKHKGLFYSYLNGEFKASKKYEQFHPGFAYAYRRDFIDNMGGLFDESILGAADRFMSMSLLGKPECSYPPNVSNGYKERMNIWSDRANKYVRGNVGYMPGMLLHYWHGKKIDRKYKSRWNILVDNNYDPEFDLKPDWQGLYQLTDRNPQLKYDIRSYFQQRNEDSIDL
jgi:hypothetical protein